MKTVLILLIVIVIASCRAQRPAVHTSNDIDQLQTTEDVQAFAKKIKLYISHTWEVPNIPDTLNPKDDCRILYDSVKSQSWYKTDIDGNGTTDLLVTGDVGFYIVGRNNDSIYITSRIYSSHCVLDTGKNNFALYHLDKDFRQKNRRCTFYKPYKSRKVSGLLMYSYHEYNEYWTVYDTDTLVYKFGDFIEYNNKPGNSPIKLITLKAWTDYEDFNLTIYGNTREARLEGYGYDNNIIIIDSLSYQQLADIVNYTNFSNLKRIYSPDKKYHVLSLSVEYDNGTSVNIEYFDLYSNRCLNLLFNELKKLELSQKWSK